MVRRSSKNASFLELVELATEHRVSSMQDPKQERSRERVAAIISASISVIAKKGIAKARISDIAAEASIMPSSIYDYFKNKEELAYAIPITRLSAFFKRYQEKLPDCKTYEEKLLCYIQLTADHVGGDPDWARVFYLENWPSVHVQAEDVRLVVDDYIKIIIKILEEGAEAGEWPAPSDAHIAANLIVGGMNQIIITWLLYQNPKDMRRAIGDLGKKLVLILKSGYL